MQPKHGTINADHADHDYNYDQPNQPDQDHRAANQVEI